MGNAQRPLGPFLTWLRDLAAFMWTSLPIFFVVDACSIVTI